MTHTDSLHKLTLSEFRERLKDRGIEIGLSTLSEMIKDGDIAEQLEAQRQGNKLLFKEDAVTVLAAFISEFRENPKLKNAARPDALRSFLRHRQPEGALVLAGQPASPGSGSLALSDFREKANIGEEIVRAMQLAGVIPAPDDKLLTIKEASEEYGISSGSLHKLSVKEGGKRKVKRSRILIYLRDL